MENDECGILEMGNQQKAQIKQFKNMQTQKGALLNKKIN